MIASDVLGRALVGVIGFKRCNQYGHPADRWDSLHGKMVRVEHEPTKVEVYVFDESVSPPIVAYRMTFTDGVPLSVIVAALRAC